MIFNVGFVIIVVLAVGLVWRTLFFLRCFIRLGVNCGYVIELIFEDSVEYVFEVVS